MPDERRAFENQHAGAVREMFATIAARYDLLNHLLSCNTDRRWRRVVARKLHDSIPPGSARILDVACGTGDLSLTLFEIIGARVLGIDFCRPMLEIAARKSLDITFIEGDALGLPFIDRSFDGLTIAFGLRNLSSLERGLREFYRVLKPGGRIVVLEFSRPVIPGFRLLFQFYFQKVVPFVGGLVSGSKGAYQYLPDSVTRFPDQATLASLLSEMGFRDVSYQNLTGGIAAVHFGRRPN